MSRSNGPVTRGTQQSHDWQHLHEPDPSAQPPSGAAHQPYQWPALNAQQPNAPYGYAHDPAGGAHDPHGHDAHGFDPHGHAPQHDQQPSYPAYHFPQQGAHPQPAQPSTPYYGNQPPAAQPQSQQGFTTQFEQYLTANQQRANAQPPQDQAGYGRHAPEPFLDDGLAQLQHQQSQQRPSHASLRDQLRATQDQLRNTQEHLRTPQQFDQWQQPQHDTRNYDLGSYMPAQTAEPAGYGASDDHHQGGHYDQQQWQDPHAYGNQPFDHQADGYYAQHGEALPVAEQPEGDDHDDGEYEVEEPRRGRRGLLVVGALVGAIIVGGGMAYGYKMIVGPGSSGTPPVIKADNRPTKTAPADPGGKQFAHTDSKLMGRLEADGSGGAAQNAETDENGVRKVSTVIVGRDGSIGPPSEPRLPQPTVSVPGMTIVDGFGGRTPPSLPPPRPIEPIRPAPQAVVPPAVAQPPTPAIISRAVAEENQRAPSPEIQAAQSRVAAVAPAAPPTPQPPVKRAAVREEAPAPVRSAPITRSGASSGYVAVLSSQRSRMDALKTFADLQQKYTDVLQNKIPDVQEADLSARGLGMMYRVVVGPPGSREAANSVCGQLRNAGFQGCWVTAY